MKNREFVMLAEKYDPDRHHVGGHFFSEKRDGMRALWLPTTRGILAKDIKFANVAKDGRLVEESRSTGLWSRYGKVIHAPDWWVDCLPEYPLDGELYLGRSRFQELMKVVKTFSKENWEGVRYHVFDAPNYDEIFLPGQINNPNYKKLIGLAEKLEGPIFSNQTYFELRYEQMLNRMETNRVIKIEEQTILPVNTYHAEHVLQAKLIEITKEGGEGLIVRSPIHSWSPVRSKHMLKVKKVLDSEAVIVGYVLGTKRLEGMLGAIRVDWNGKRFDIGTGFNDVDRRLEKHKGEPGSLTDQPISEIFRIGEVITFLYRELSNDGIPKEARYFRSEK